MREKWRLFLMFLTWPAAARSTALYKATPSSSRRKREADCAVCSRRRMEASACGLDWSAGPIFAALALRSASNRGERRAWGVGGLALSPHSQHVAVRFPSGGAVAVRFLGAMAERPLPLDYARGTCGADEAEFLPDRGKPDSYDFCRRKRNPQSLDPQSNVIAPPKIILTQVRCSRPILSSAR